MTLRRAAHLTLLGRLAADTLNMELRHRVLNVSLSSQALLVQAYLSCTDSYDRLRGFWNKPRDAGDNL
jgi:hypothetical protein